MKKIVLTKGQEAIVDDDMFDLVNSFKWHAHLGDGNRYSAITTIHFEGIKKNVPMHHFVVGKPLHGLVVDHINGIGTDNRRENLRIVTTRENAINSKCHRNGKLPGSKLVKGNKWECEIYLDGKKKYLGRFKTELDAHEAYMKAFHRRIDGGNRRGPRLPPTFNRVPPLSVTGGKI